MRDNFGEHTRNSATPPSPVRCAIYTRKSTDEGLDQDFNSLDAQRESGEAYIASQKHDGWQCLPDRYDDGGFSGGNMDRPALTRLITEVEAGRIDIIVVHKVDRLSRSLLDFSRLMEKFQQHEVSFVSVTQQFSTTSSMGRLTLNILFSFAQFEREIIAERTREKMSAARRKGKWVGGIPILGYDIDPVGRCLVVNEDEAEKVREIFRLYLETRSLIGTAEELNRRGWVTKNWTSKRGSEHGGKIFDKAVLSRLLTNITYTGKISYRGEVYDGEQQRIITMKTWRQVQRTLRQNGSGRKRTRNRHQTILGGLIYCRPCDAAMTPVHSTGGSGKQYQYYVCSQAQKRGWGHCVSKSLPAREVERFVIERLQMMRNSPELIDEMVRQSRGQALTQINALRQERRVLKQKLSQFGEELNGANGAAPRQEGATAQSTIAEIREVIRKTAQELSRVEEALYDSRRRGVRREELVRALAPCDEAFSSATPRDQHRLLQQLLQRVDYDGAEGKIALTLNPDGVSALAKESIIKRKGKA
jgi:site-specific DNA recombinase